MDKMCECGHPQDEHGHDDEFPGSTACTHEDCTCIAFEWDGDGGGTAVTRSRKKDSSS